MKKKKTHLDDDNNPIYYTVSKKNKKQTNRYSTSSHNFTQRIPVYSSLQNFVPGVRWETVYIPTKGQYWRLTFGQSHTYWVAISTYIYSNIYAKTIEVNFYMELLDLDKTNF